MTTTNNMTVSYDGKVAIVTGGASGMGAAVARLIVASGGSVVIADINEAAGAAVAAELGRRARFLRVDVTSFEDAQKLAAGTIEAFGRIDVLFNNAGTPQLGDTAVLDPAEWHRVINVNLSSAFLVTKAVLPHLRKLGADRLSIHVQSAVSRGTMPCPRTTHPKPASLT